MVTPRGWCFPLTLRLLVAVVQNDIGGVVHPRGQVLDGASAELIHPEDVVVDVGDAVDVVLEDVDAEGLVELCGWTERARYRWGGEGRGGSAGMEARPRHSTVLHAIGSHHGVAAVHPHAADQGELGVGPVQPLVKVVHGQTWGDADGFRRTGAGGRGYR